MVGAGGPGGVSAPCPNAELRVKRKQISATANSEQRTAGAKRERACVHRFEDDDEDE